MPSLSKLLVDHASLLILDAASTAVQVGLLRRAATPVWVRSPGDAGTAVFAGTDRALGTGGLGIADVEAFAYCEGPGSRLGIRTVAMALRAWLVLKTRPAFAYDSLALAGAFAHRDRPRAFAMIADARRDTWHCRRFPTETPLPPLQRIATTGLPAGELVMPAEFRVWSQPGRPVTALPYEVDRFLAALPDADLFRATAQPDAFQHEAPGYRLWTSQVHSAATAPSR